MVRYDERGCGLSDSEAGDPSVDTWVADLEAVVDAVGLDRFALLGVSQGAAIAVAYAAKHPERVTDLVLYGGYARGRQAPRPGRGGGRGDRGDPRGLDDADPRSAACSACCSFQTARLSRWPGTRICSGARRPPRPRHGCIEARGALDVSQPRAAEVRARTLVMHARDDRVVPVEEGRLLAALIPDARLVLLESANHILLADEPAWDPSSPSSTRSSAPDPPPRPPAPVADLSARELEVLELVAAGLTNEAIAERLYLSVRTVERHLSNIYAKLGVSGQGGACRGRGAASRSCASRRRFVAEARLELRVGRQAAAAKLACWHRCRRGRVSVRSSQSRIAGLADRGGRDGTRVARSRTRRSARPSRWRRTRSAAAAG